MKLKDVPQSPAYLVSHDLYDNGAMMVWPVQTIARAREYARKRQDHVDALSADGVRWEAYEKLPRRRVFRYFDYEPSIS